MPDFDKYSALSFDCYGTLIDWESGILAAAQPWIAANAGKIDDDSFMAAFGRLERQVEGETPDMLYPLILEEVLRRIAAEQGLEASDEAAKAFGTSVPDWPAFPDSHDALVALSKKFKLIILSNVDRQSFSGSNKRLDVTFDTVITSQDVCIYKPDLRIFEALMDGLP